MINILQHWLLWNVNENGERTFSFARKPGADTQIQKEEIEIDVLG